MMTNVITTGFKGLYLAFFFINLLLIIPSLNLEVMLDVTDLYPW